MAILFISNVVPDRVPYNGIGFSRSGNNVLLGIAKALPRSESPVCLSCRPVASFPKGPLWLRGEIVPLEDGRVVKILPTLNVKIIKNLFWGVFVRREIKAWSEKHPDNKRSVLVYNIYAPPISWVFRACVRNACKLTAILYDLGVPPASLGLDRLTMSGYRVMEKEAKKYIPLLDGRVVVNEKIVDSYAPKENFLLIDGGINDAVVNRLFPLAVTPPGPLVLVLAGMLWEQNGTGLILDCLKAHPELDVNVIFAGSGIDVPKIEDYSEKDRRVAYVGQLSPEALFKLYGQADVLLNLRREEEVDFHFPSKLLEYLVTGKHVISTPIAHTERDYGPYLSVLKDISADGLAEMIKTVMRRGKNELYLQGVKARRFMLETRRWCIRTAEIVQYMNGL